LDYTIFFLYSINVAIATAAAPVTIIINGKIGVPLVVWGDGEGDDVGEEGVGVAVGVGLWVGVGVGEAVGTGVGEGVGVGSGANVAERVWSAWTLLKLTV
jgi:hypothetical protein